MRNEDRNGTPFRSSFCWLFLVFRLPRSQFRRVPLKDFFKKERDQQYGNCRHKHNGPPLLYTEHGGLSRQQDHHDGAGEMGGSQLESRVEQTPYAVIKSAQEREQPAEHSRRKDEGEVIGHVKHIGQLSTVT